METAPLIIRPNGKFYRARKPPAVHLYVGDYLGESEIMVTRLGPDEKDKARELAMEEFEKHDFDLMDSGYFGWWRDSIRGNEREWVYDSATGTPGWVFRVE
jgi:hypothetical protein